MSRKVEPKPTVLYTHDGHKLTILENRFINEYIATGNARQSAIKAGYSEKSANTLSQKVLKKEYVKSEIAYRVNSAENRRVASGKDVLEYLSAVMRGEIKDQFGLDAPLSERTRAASELAKRTVDIENRGNNSSASVTLKIIK